VSSKRFTFTLTLVTGYAIWVTLESPLHNSGADQSLPDCHSLPDCDSYSSCNPEESFSYLHCSIGASLFVFLSDDMQHIILSCFLALTEYSIGSLS
jgi:hypothetical protein